MATVESVDVNRRGLISKQIVCDVVFGVEK